MIPAVVALVVAGGVFGVFGTAESSWLLTGAACVLYLIAGTMIVVVTIDDWRQSR